MLVRCISDLKACAADADNAPPARISIREPGQLMLMMLVLFLDEKQLILTMLVHEAPELGQLMLIMRVSYSCGFENLGG